MRASWRQLAPPAAILALTLVAYVPAIRAGFIWDDNVYLTENAEVIRPGQFTRIWWGTQFEQYYPLTASSFWLEYRGWGAVERAANHLPADVRRMIGLDALGPLKPAGYHITNVLLHGLGAVLICLALRRLLVPGAWLAGALFALHPVNVASVAWVSERKNVLSLVLVMLSLLAYLRFEQLRDPLRVAAERDDPESSGISSDENPKSKIQNQESFPASPRPRVSMFAFFYGLSQALFLLALFAKTVVVTLPAVLLLCAWWRRRRIGLYDLLFSLPFFALAAALGWVTTLFEQTNPETYRTLAQRLAGAGWAVWFYLSKALLPLDLAMVYPRWDIRPSLLTFGPLMLLAALAGLAFRFRKVWARPLIFAFGFYGLTLAPVLGFVAIAFMDYSLVADHWQYWPMAGITALAAGAGGALRVRRPALRRAGAIVAAVLVAALLVLTWSQAAPYKESVLLWDKNVRLNPTGWVGYKNRGDAYALKGDPLRALADLNEAIRLNPDLPTAADAYSNRGKIYCDLGKPYAGAADAGLTADQRLKKAVDYLDAAVADCTRAIQLRPRLSAAWDNRGNAYYYLGQYDKAIADSTQAILLRPDLAFAYNIRANAQDEVGQYDLALADYTQAITLKPDFADAWNNRGVAWQHKRLYDRAVADHSRAIELAPEFPGAYTNRAEAFFRLGKYSEAWADVRKAQSLGGPVSPSLLKNLTAATGRTE